jgi:hypothetical protein
MDTSRTAAAGDNGRPGQRRHLPASSAEFIYGRFLARSHGAGRMICGLRSCLDLQVVVAALPTPAQAENMCVCETKKHTKHLAPST